MKTYLVGGAVRDRLLGVPAGERDWVVVGATEADMLAQGFRRADQEFPVFLHPQSGEEYALARRERKSGVGYRGFEVETGPDVTLAEDLARRDLTVNAIAQDDAGVLIDPYDGQGDIRRRLLRHTTEAFVEDPLRLLRLARFAAQLGAFGFEPADETLPLLELIVRSGELDQITPARRWQALKRSLGYRHAARFFVVLGECAALPILYPWADAPLAADATPLDAAGRVDDGHPELRFAVLLAALGFDEDVLRALDLPVERGYRQQLQWLLQLRQAVQGPLRADRLVELFGRLGLYQHSGRLDDLLVGLAALDPGTTVADPLRRALAGARSVDTAELVAQGLRHDSLGAALRERRVQAIAKMLASDS